MTSGVCLYNASSPKFERLSKTVQRSLALSAYTNGDLMTNSFDGSGVEEREQAADSASVEVHTR
jgi:hypothetical protein